MSDSIKCFSKVNVNSVKIEKRQPIFKRREKASKSRPVFDETMLMFG